MSANPFRTDADRAADTPINRGQATAAAAAAAAREGRAHGATTGTLEGDTRLARAAARRAHTNADARTDVRTTKARQLNGEIDREAAAHEALRQMAEAGRVKPTRAQRKAAEVAAATASGTVTAKPAKLPKSLQPVKGKVKPQGKKRKTAADRRKARKKIVNRLPKKWKVTRGVARATLGGGALVTGTVRLTVRGTAAGIRAAKRRSGDGRKWTPKVAGQKLFSGRYSCCGETYNSAQALNAHFLAEHENEGSAALAQEPALLAPGTTRSSAGKLLVLLPPLHAGKRRRRVPAGRHRPGTRRVSAEQYLRAHRDKLTRIGDRAMSDCGEARNVAQAFIAWGNLAPRADRPWTLDDLRAVLVGLERAMLVGTEAIDTMERTLNRPGGEYRGCNIDMSITRPGARRAREGLTEAARGLTAVIADFETYYAPYLRGQLAAPAISPNRR